MRHLIQATFLISLLFVTALSADAAMAENQDKTPLYDTLLQQYVTNGKVDYIGLKKEEAQLDIYLDNLAKTDPEQMEEKDRFAFYINFYNAYTIKLILANFEDGKPPASIKDIGSFFPNPGQSNLLTLAVKHIPLIISNTIS